jgi:hypothetical protein
VGFGAVVVFITWLPLAWIAGAVSHRLVVGKLGAGELELRSLPTSTRLEVIAMLAGPHAIALALASMAGGFLVTRYGDDTRPRDSALAGFVVGVLALGITYAQVGFSMAAMVVPVVASASSALGGSMGRRRRPR